jgi:hypothetical protein
MLLSILLTSFYKQNFSSADILLFVLFSLMLYVQKEDLSKHLPFFSFCHCMITNFYIIFSHVLRKIKHLQISYIFFYTQLLKNCKCFICDVFVYAAGYLISKRCSILSDRFWCLIIVEDSSNMG